MSVIGLFSVKGSPGVSTLALALAAHGREQGAVLIEADTAGGDAALRFGIPQHPGLAQFAARARQINARRDVLDGLVRTVGVDGARPVDLLAAPVEPAAVEAAVTALHAQPDALATAGRGRTLVLDLGRLDEASPGFGLVESCDVAVVVVRGDAVSLGHAREAGWVTGLPVRCGFVLVDTGPYRIAEAATALEIPPIAAMPFARNPLQGRSAAKAVAALWNALAAAGAEPMRTPELVEASDS